MSADRINRDRQRALADRIDRAPAAPPDGARSLLVTTTVIDTYPTTAQAFYAVLATGATGSEVEGATPVFTQDTTPFTALNLGTPVPPQGQQYLVEQAAGGLWVFRYDG